MKVDLHIHTTASDGQYTPAQIVSMARDMGLDMLAISDHDTVDGLPEALAAGRELGMQVLPGIELSAKEYPTFHILGYGFSPDAPGLTALCQRMKKGRDDRKYRILDYLAAKGMTVPLDEVEQIAGGNIIGRPHFAQAMVRRGYVSTNREAFDRYLDTAEFHAHIERPKPPVKECIETIKASGGWVSLAHPYQTGLSGNALETLVQQLKEYGLDAIECCYPRHTPVQEAFYRYLAKKYDLHITGGSDFHGERIKPDIRLTAWELETDWLCQHMN